MEVETADNAPKAKPKKSRRRLIVLFVLLAVLAFGIGGIAAQLLTKPVTIPQKIAGEVPFPIYLPEQLPGNFKIVSDSFAFQDGTLIFKATDSTGVSIVFTEQKKPPRFDFGEFYNTQVNEAQTLSGVPYPSVAAKAKKGSTKILSVVADETWLMASTNAPLTEQDLQLIAESIKLSHKP